MGNVPTKEPRSRSSSLTSHSTLASAPALGRRRAALSLSAGTSNLALFSHKSSKHEDKMKVKEKHFLDLVVRFSETCDGGYLAPLGIYKLNLDYNTDIVRGLIVARRLAPFFTPLQDFSPEWTEDELVKIVQHTPLHALESAYSDDDEPDDADNHKIHKSLSFFRRQELKRLHRDLVVRTRAAQAQCDADYVEARAAGASAALASRDLVLALYADAVECPICFLYFPPYLNRSRCCRQDICSECFVQIKRLDPHPPHDHDADSDALPHTLISEQACCPYCAMPNFGVTYDPPRAFRVGIEGLPPLRFIALVAVAPIPEDAVDLAEDAALPTGTTAPSVTAEGSPTKRPATRLRRRSSIPADRDIVVLTDAIRPDWEQRLTSAISKLARKAATASVIHASNLILDDSPAAAPNQLLYLMNLEERMINEAMRLLLLDEELRSSK